MMGMFMSTTP